MLEKRWGYSVPEYLWPNILFTMYLDILHNFFFFLSWVVRWINKWILIEKINRNKAKTNVLCSLFHASTSWLESVRFIILAKEIINANIVQEWKMFKFNYLILSEAYAPVARGTYSPFFLGKKKKWCLV